MFVVFIEDDQNSIGRIQTLFEGAPDLSVAVSPDLNSARDILVRPDIAIVFVSKDRTQGLGLKQDFASLRRITSAPIAVVAHHADEQDLKEAMSCGAEMVVEHRDLSVSLLRQSVRNLRARKASSNLRQVQHSLQSLIAPVEYLEFGLTTLLEGLKDGRQTTTRAFIGHLLDTVQTLKKCAQAQYGEVSDESVGRLIEHSRERMARLARHRGVSLRADWETARFDSGAPSQLAELGLQHILEGVLRCCGEGDGIWLHGEKGADTSIIRIHLSRRVLRSAEVLFPGTASGPGMGLDASSSIQLGALLLSLTRDKVELVSEKRQQMLSLFL